MSTIPKIALAIHTYGPISPKVYPNHISKFAGWAKEYNLHLFHVDGLKAAEGRNALVKSAIEKDCTHILFIDADHIIDSTLLPCLLGNEGATAVSGLVIKRNSDNEQVGFIKAEDGVHYHTISLPLNGRTYEVDACAFGCTLIDLSVFKELPEPYFRDVMKQKDDGTWFQQRSDIKFCHDIKALGKSIRIDTRVKIGHVGAEQVYYPESKEFQLAIYTEAMEIVKAKGPKCSVVDIGCGDGAKLHRYIEPFCSLITGWDIPEMVKLCKEDYPNQQWLECDLEKYQCVSVSADVVICADVIEHIKNIDNVFNHIISSMNKDGVCVLSTPNIDTVTDEVKQNEKHCNAWNRKSFCEVIESYGLDIIKCTEHNEIFNYKSIVCVCKLKEN